jgi:hypothetical protein
VWTLLKKLWNGEREDHVQDYIPISGNSDFKKRLAKARERHGKQFRSQTTVKRVEPPSRDLVELNAASARPESKAEVRSIKKGAK